MLSWIPTCVYINPLNGACIALNFRLKIRKIKLISHPGSSPEGIKTYLLGHVASNCFPRNRVVLLLSVMCNGVLPPQIS